MHAGATLPPRRLRFDSPAVESERNLVDSIAEVLSPPRRGSGSRMEKKRLGGGLWPVHFLRRERGRFGSGQSVLAIGAPAAQPERFSPEEDEMGGVALYRGLGGVLLSVALIAGPEAAAVVAAKPAVGSAAAPDPATAARVITIPADYKAGYPFSLRFADVGDREHRIDLATARFSTENLVGVDETGARVFREPDASAFPASLFRAAFGAGSTDEFLVQAKDAASQDRLRKLLERQEARVLGYIPDGAYLVRLDEKALAKLREVESVFWIGVYQPAYRIAPDLDYVIGQDEAHPLRIRARLDLEDYPTEAAVRALLGALPAAEVLDVTRGRRDWIVRIAGPAGQARRLAARKGVLWVERFVDFKLHNNVARTSASVPTGRGALDGPIMDVEDVWARGIRGEGQIASASDTGLSTGVLATLHKDYGEQGSATNPLRVLKGYALGRATWDDDQSIDGGHGTHTSGSIVGNGFRSGATPSTNTFPSTSVTGTAPKAQFVFQSIMDSGGGLGGIPADLNTLFQQTYDDGARVHSNSWGAPSAGQYSTDSEALDEFAWNRKDMVITFSAGNSGTDSGAGADGVINTDSIGAPGTAKNCITVGASENYRPDFVYEYPQNDCTGTAFDQTAWGWFNGTSFPANPVYADPMANNASGMGAFSSRGPTDDSRIKPDIVAPGIAIISTRTDKNQAYEQWGICNVPADQRSYYVTMGGTSMSNPLTAGTAVLVRQYYVDGWHANHSDVTNASAVPAQGFNPSSALVKATLVNGAWDIAPGQYGSASPQPEIPPSWDRTANRDLPNNAEGFGRVDVEASLFPGAGWGRNAARVMMVRDVDAGLSTGGRTTYTFNVGSSVDPFIATLVWTDPYAAAGAGTKLVNNLDLEVTSPSGRRYTVNRVDTYVTAPTDFARDTRNNVEQVKVTSPEPGLWTIEVVGTAVPGNGVSGTNAQPYALVTSGVSCTPLAVPTGVSAIVNGDNRIDVSWSAVPGAAAYAVYRGTSSGAVTTFLGTVADPATSYSDTTVEGGLTYWYAVASLSPDSPPCESSRSSEASATATGTCSLAPTSPGGLTVTSAGTATCGLVVTWTAATSPCGGSISYDVYRSTDSAFVPGLANRIATGLASTGYSDAGPLTSGTPYYYVVRAVDGSNGLADANTVRVAGSAWGALSTQSLYGPESFESFAAGNMAGWTAGFFTGSAADWTGVRACAASSGTNVFRYGGSASCTTDYSVSRHAVAYPAALAVPAGTVNARLSFWHRWAFEDGWDGGYLRISTNGTNWTLVPPAAILSGPYTDTLSYGVGAWTGSQATFVNTVVDLDAACNAVTGESVGCGGRTIYVGFVVYSDITETADGWFIDDVHVYADVPGPCSSGGTPTPAAGSNSPVCEGGTISLTASTIAGATYAWTGPDSFASSEQNPSIPGATTAMAGTYSVTATVGGVPSAPGTTDIVVNSTPVTPTITAPASVAPEQTFPASVPDVAGVSYAWAVTNGTVVSGDGTREITVKAGPTGPVEISVVQQVVATGCASAAGEVSIPVALPATRFYPATPCRLFDTRESAGDSAAAPALAAGETRTLTIGTRCGLDAAAIRSLAVNQTITVPAADGELVLWRGDIPTPPVTSSISFRTGRTRANNGILELSRAGDGTFKVHNRSTGTVHFILDVNGYFK